ncbi:hypothetical protein BZB76_3257 [Actinomadura pelletieri DSM 43383]|uniref:Uncharacterized protein n=1 Tax=Actinomadura pelletieri DSM 43383 TaxID=1120940 RepID=A0A495QP41_9ACTN|nr:DUF6177 family protein [Actinomadura pelletieri]RKS74738.1 hypothetical protein BZB76_3257 [Actinomadura pelletieri DSM 43383]
MIDVMAERVGVVMQNRPVVALSSWTAEAIRACAEAGKGLQVVTPAHSRLTLPLRLALTGPECRWVVTDPAGGYYDGFNGATLAWDGGAFSPDGGTAEAFKEAGPDGTQLVVAASVRHTAYDTLTVGVVAQVMCEELGGAPPAGWGTSEPAGIAWDVERLTKLCRDRAPRPTWLVFVGDGVVGTMTVRRTTSGVQETVTAGVGREVDVRGLVERLDAGFSLVSVVAQKVPGRADLTVEPRWSGPPVPVGMAVGPEAQAEAGMPVTGRADWVELSAGPEGWAEFARILRG